MKQVTILFLVAALGGCANENPFMRTTVAGGFTPIYSSGLFDAFPGITTYGVNNSYYCVTFKHSAQGDSSTDGTLMFTTSLDGGNTWSAPASIFSPPTNFHEQDTNVTTLRRDGSLMISGMVESNSGSPTQGQVFVVQGTVSGATITWGAPTYLAAAFASTPNGFGFASDKVLELQNGNLLLSVYAAQSGATHYSSGVYTGTWNGSGFTWSSSATLIAAGSATEQYNETGLIQLPNGNVLAVIRHDVSSGSTGYSQSTSTDNGATWSGLTQPVNSAVVDRPGLGIDSSGRIIVSSANNGGFPAYWTSDDSGSTWTSPAQLSTLAQEYASLVYIGKNTWAEAIGLATAAGTKSAVYFNLFFDGPRPSSSSNIARVQSTTGSATGSLVETLAFALSNTAGNLLLALCRSFITGNSLTNVTVSDTQGNNWIVIGSTGSTASVSVNFLVAYCVNCKGGANTVSFTSNNSTVFTQCGMVVAEYAGIAKTLPLDAWTAFAATTSATVTPNSLTTTYPDLIILAFNNDTTGTPNYGVPTQGFSIQQGQNTLPSFADLLNAPAGAYAPTVSVGAGSVIWEAMTIGFTAAQLGSTGGGDLGPGYDFFYRF